MTIKMDFDNNKFVFLFTLFLTVGLTAIAYYTNIMTVLSDFLTLYMLITLIVVPMLLLNRTKRKKSKK